MSARRSPRPVAVSTPRSAAARRAGRAAGGGPLLLLLAAAGAPLAGQGEAPSKPIGEPAATETRPAIEVPASTPPETEPPETEPVDEPGRQADGEPDREPVREAGEVFVNAGAAYEAGDYPQAIALYRELLDRGYRNGHLLYNLGNAYLRNGELGRAIAAYREGRALRPRDEDIRANLEFARKSIQDAIAPPEPAPLWSTLFFWHYGLSPAELTWTVVALNFLFWTVWVLRLFRRDSEVLRWLFILCLVLTLAGGASLLIRRALPQPVAVIIPQEIEARTAPDSESVVRFKLHAGTEVRLAERREGWLRISLPDGQQGWIEEGWAAVVER